MKIKNLTIERIFDVDLDKVWKAWTQPQFIEKWFGADPNGTVVLVEIDLREGGQYKIRFLDSGGAVHCCIGHYLGIHYPNSLKMTLEWENEIGYINEITLDFIIAQGKTKQIFTLVNMNPDSLHDYEYGWNSTFNKMEKALNT